MFLGHFGAGFAAKKIAPQVSLGTAFLAAQFVDLLWPTLLLLGVERVAIDPGNTRVTPLDFESYPLSHSLVAVVTWGCALAVVNLSVSHRLRSAVTVGLLVVSHWVLDLLVHRPDLPLVPGSAFRVGFGLWNSMAWTLVLEFGLLAMGVSLYLRSTRAVNRTGVWALWGLVAFLTLIYAGNLLGDPPPGATAIAWVGQAQWLLVGWGYWVDRNRVSR